jgi:hypothetical protein
LLIVAAFVTASQSAQYIWMGEQGQAIGPLIAIIAVSIAGACAVVGWPCADSYSSKT